MSQPLLSLGRSLWRIALPVAALFVLLLWLDTLPGSKGGYGSLCWLLVFLPLTLLAAWRSRWVWRMAWRVRRFRTVTSPHFVLHHASGLEGSWDLGVLLQRFESDLDELTQHFGFTIGGRHPVFLFASHRDLAGVFAGVFRGPLGGVAVHAGKLICLADDANPAQAFRHELCHQFAFHWNLLAPPLLSEGLPTWFQHSQDSKPLHVQALSVLRSRGWRLASLLSQRYFFARPNRHHCYVLAGSFTGFLIQQFGWASYGRFFRGAGPFRFRAKFKRHFGTTLEEAERLWRDYLELAAPRGRQTDAEAGRPA